MLGVMQATPAPAVTWKDFLALPDDDRRELIEGRLMEIDVPTQLRSVLFEAQQFVKQVDESGWQQS